MVQTGVSSGSSLPVPRFLQDLVGDHVRGGESSTARSRPCAVRYDQVGNWRQVSVTLQLSFSRPNFHFVTL